MQISIEQHSIVTQGLAEELAIRSEQLQNAMKDLEASRDVIAASDRVIDGLRLEVAYGAKRLEKIRSTLLGTSGIEEPQTSMLWSSALQMVTDYEKQVRAERAAQDETIRVLQEDLRALRMRCRKKGCRC